MAISRPNAWSSANYAMTVVMGTAIQLSCSNTSRAIARRTGLGLPDRESNKATQDLADHGPQPVPESLVFVAPAVGQSRAGVSPMAFADFGVRLKLSSAPNIVLRIAGALERLMNTMAGGTRTTVAR